jgi:glycine betaine/proline transport system substrate-binding protein
MNSVLIKNKESQMTRSPRRRVLAALIALIIASITACSGQTSSFGGSSGGGSGSGGQSGGDGGKTVSISVVAGWDEDVAASNLWKSLLEERGYTVNMQELDIASTFTGVANGQVDLYMDAWLPTTHGAYWDRFKDQLEVVTTWQEGKNTIVVPDYVNDVNTVADLKGKAAMFDGRIVGIEAGAGEMKAMREKVIPAYGLTDFNLVEGSSPAMLASLDSAIKQKQPIVVTLWQPHWAFSRFPLKVLDDTQAAFGPPDQMQIVATKGWSAANPEAAGWLKNFEITPEQLSDLMLKIQTAGKGKEQEAAKQWAADNKSVVDAWFNAS